MKNRIFALIIAIAAVMLMLVSCDIGGIFTPDPPVTDNGGNNNKPSGSESPKYTSIVYTEDGIDFSNIRLEMMDVIGQGVTVNHINNAPDVESEVVFGDSDRAVTVAAKQALESAIASSTKNDIGYIIYSDGKSIAIYWQHPDMKELAVADFLDVCVNEKRLVLEQGTVTSSLFVRREFETDKYWLALERIADESVVAALKSLNAFYEKQNLIDWMANLYDPDIGAFYYSISARDNEPFRPDIESTYQILGLLESSGALEDQNDLPAEIKAKIINFALNTQSKKDGYFYHPQWPQDRDQLATDRYGRDLTRATGLISALNIDINNDGIEDDIYPYYCAPNGTKCEAHKDGGSCSFPIADTVSYISANIDGFVTGALGSGVSAAVSTANRSYVSATAVSSHPDYSSRAAFKAWLYEYNSSIKENSGKAHNLSAISSEIRAHGYTDIVVEQIMTAQREVYEEQTLAGIEPTGLWQRSVDYNAVWGILKYASYYNSKEWTTPMSMEYILCMVKTCIKVIALPPQGNELANGMFNMWQAVDRILTHVERHYTDKEVEQVYNLLRENAADLIANSLDKLEPFKRADGSFSYKSSGHSLAIIYGSEISLGEVEGDVNAVALCCQMYEGVFRALGYDQVPLFTKSDGERFIETVLSCEPIEKNENEAGLLDFESSALPNGISVSIGAAGGKGEIQPDPVNPTNNAFLFSSAPTTSSNVIINTQQLGGECYVFDADMYVASDTKAVTGYVFQIFLADAYIIALKVNSDGTVTIGDDRDGSGLASTFGSVDMDEWFRLTVHLYVPSEDNGIDSPVIKIWIDSEYCGESENFYNYNKNGVFVEGYNFVKLWSMKRGDTHIYFDNCYFAVDNIPYEESNDTFEDVREH